MNHRSSARTFLASKSNAKTIQGYIEILEVKDVKNNRFERPHGR